MITINDVEYRNLEEQVQKNKEDIAKHYAVDRVLADFGIKVVGVVEKPEDLPDATTYNGDYGDAFSVGLYAPYSFYIFTRPDANAGGTEPYWLDIGMISIQGPEGPRGPQGETGPQGVRGNNMTVGTSVPDPSSPSLINGDVFLSMPSAMIYRFKDSPEGKGWESVGSIKGPKGAMGPQGPQGEPGAKGQPGEKGDRGDVGGFINIWGVLANASQLPTPASLDNLTVAYLVGAASPYDLYVQIGENSDQAMWTNTGPFNAATAVSVNGNFQNIWDADTKVSKYTGSGGLFRVYGVDTNNNETVIAIGSSDQSYFPGTLPYVRPKDSGTVQPNGYLITHNPAQPYQAATKDYVDTQINGLGGGSLYLHKVDLIPKNYSLSNGYIANGFSLTLLSKNSTAITTIEELVAIRKNMLSFTGDYYTFDDANGLREIENLEISGTETNGYYFYVKYIDEYGIPPTFSYTSLSISNYDISEDTVTEV